MQTDLDIDRLIDAVHAMTGEWLDGSQAQLLASYAGSREELLAHGVVDLGWLRFHPAAERHFGVLGGAAAMAPNSSAAASDLPAPAHSTGMSRADAMRLVERFAEAPTEADPLETLIRLASENAASQ